TLNPASPISITTNKPVRLPVTIGAEPDFAVQKAVLRMQFQKLAGPDQLQFQLNGNELKAARLAQDWLEIELPSSALRAASNSLEISCVRDTTTSPVLTDLYVAITRK